MPTTTTDRTSSAFATTPHASELRGRDTAARKVRAAPARTPDGGQDSVPVKQLLRWQDDGGAI